MIRARACRCQRRRRRRLIWRGRVRASAIWLSLLAASAVAPGLSAVALATPQPVGVIAPAGSRLAGELKRELAAANLASVSVVASDRQWPTEMTDLVSIPYLQGVVVGSNDERMIVFSRTVTSGRVEVRFELRFDPSDRPARRRACLAVVEGLRALSETAPAPPLGAELPPEGTPSSVAAAATVAMASAAASPPALTPVPATVTAHVQWPDAGAGAPEAVLASPREPWSLGVATMLDVDRGLGAPMGHLAFMWFIPVRSRIAFRIQAMWPLMGTALGPAATDVRIWTFGAAAGLQYTFAPVHARVHPFAGLATGSQLLLTDTSGSTEVDKSRAPFVPSANLRANTGVRLAVASRVQLLIEIEATRDWLLQSSRQSVYRDSIANTFAFHSSVGALFEY